VPKCDYIQTPVVEVYPASYRRSCTWRFEYGPLPLKNVQ